MINYRKRIADDLLRKKMAAKGAVLIQGPKWCGKTTTAEQASESVIYINDPDKINQNLLLADVNPRAILEGEKPRLIDEWQLIPKLWDTIRFAVDHEGKFGQYILTGSAVPVVTDEIHHTGTGRFAWLKMRPMSLFESGDSNGEVSLKKIFETSGENIYATSRLEINDIAYLICRGGWPLSVGLSEDNALQQARDYYDAVVNEDISRVDGVKRNSVYADRLLKSYARNQGTQATINTLLADLEVNEGSDPCGKTINQYINAFEKIFLIEDMPAWNPNLRSKTAIRTADTRYFVDPSIAAAALGLGPGDLINDLNTMGLLFETMAVRDLRVYADALDAQVFHYRDRSGLECDSVIHLRNGNYGLVEIKLGGDKLINDGVESLTKLGKLIDSSGINKPSFKMILTGNGSYAYRRPDGILIVPIGTLQP